jgi:hypothetical protein
VIDAFSYVVANFRVEVRLRRPRLRRPRLPTLRPTRISVLALEATCPHATVAEGLGGGLAALGRRVHVAGSNRRRRRLRPPHYLIGIKPGERPKLLLVVCSQGASRSRIDAVAPAPHVGLLLHGVRLRAGAPRAAAGFDIVASVPDPRAPEGWKTLAMAVENVVSGRAA